MHSFTLDNLVNETHRKIYFTCLVFYESLENYAKLRDAYLNSDLEDSSYLTKGESVTKSFKINLSKSTDSLPYVDLKEYNSNENRSAKVSLKDMKDMKDLKDDSEMSMKRGSNTNREINSSREYFYRESKENNLGKYYYDYNYDKDLSRDKQGQPDDTNISKTERGSYRGDDESGIFEIGMMRKSSKNYINIM